MTHTVVYFTDSTDFGGAEQSLLNLLKRLDRQQWRPLLWHHASAGIQPLVNAARALSIDTRTVPAMPEGRGITALPHFIQQLRAARPIVFHAHLTWQRSCKYALLAATLARVPAVIATEHAFVELPSSALARFKQRLFSSGIHQYIAVSQDLAIHLLHTFAIPVHKLQVVPNGVALEEFDQVDQAAVRELRPAGLARPVVLSVARLDELKGQRYLLEAAAYVPEALFVFLGDGPDRAMLEAQAADRHLSTRVLFPGHRSDVAVWLAACDIFVLPSLWEGMSVSILEAMAARKPIVATAIGGTPEVVVHGKTGLLVPKANALALANAIRQLINDQAYAQRLATAGRARVEREFSSEVMTRRVTQIYDQVLNDSAAR